MSGPGDSVEPEPIEIDGELVAEVRRLPVVRDARGRQLDGAPRATLPAAVAAATGGFMLGVAAFTLLRLFRRPGAARSITRKRRKLIARRRGVDVAETRSFLIDVHVLKR